MSEKSPYASLHEGEPGASNAKPDPGDAGATFVLESKGLIFSKSVRPEPKTIEFEQSNLIWSFLRIFFHY